MGKELHLLLFILYILKCKEPNVRLVSISLFIESMIYTSEGWEKILNNKLGGILPLVHIKKCVVLHFLYLVVILFLSGRVQIDVVQIPWLGKYCSNCKITGHFY